MIGFHKTANFLDVLPNSVHRKAKKAIREATEAEVERAAERFFAEEFRAKWQKVDPKAVEDNESYSRLLRVTGGALHTPAHHYPWGIGIRTG